METGTSTGGSGRNLLPNWAQGEENYTLKGEEFIQFCSQKVTLDSCRFETRMRQNAPNPISISIFSGGNTSKGKNSLSFCSRKVKHWIATVVKQKCARMHQILFQFHFFLHIECVQRICTHSICSRTPAIQHYCNQERIENNQLIGFASARPSTGILGLP